MVCFRNGVNQMWSVKRTILLAAGIIIFLILSMATIVAFWPKYDESFFELGLLGKDRRAENYYPNNNPTIGTGVELDWYLYVHNHMQTQQNISINVELLNASMGMSDNLEHKNTVSPLIEFPLSLSTDSTVFVPFSWSILDAEYQNGSIIIKRLMINNQTIDVNISALPDFSFKIAFKLWVYDPISKEYHFEWKNGNLSSSASVYIGFKVDVSKIVR